MPIPVLNLRSKTNATVTPRRDGLANRLLGVQFILLCALLLFGPLAFGAVEDWSMLVLHIGAAALLTLYAAEQLLKAEVILPSVWILAPALLFAVLITVQSLGASVAVLATRRESLNVFAYIAIFLVAWRCFRSLRRTRQFAAIVAVFGFAVAVFGMVQDFTSNGKLYWLRAPKASGWIFGPYVNHSHFAGLMEMLAPFGLVLAFGMAAPNEKRGLWGFAGLVAALSIFMSGSRGGMLAFAVELVFFAAMYARIAKPVRRPRSILVSAAFVVAMALLVAWLGRDIHFQRIGSLAHPLETAGARLTVLRDGLKMWKEKPVLGWGLGTFPIAYPKYKTFYSMAVFNAAHNDYLQLLIETGVLGFGAALTFLVGIYGLALRAMQVSDSRTGVFVKFAALVGCTGIVVHSVGDFNMQIPANAAMFFALAALAATPFRNLSRRRRGPTISLDRTG